MSNDIQRFPSSLPFPFSRAVKAGGFLFLSGQIPMNAAGEVVKGDIQEQTRAACERIGESLAACGARFDQVVYDGAAFGHAGEVHVGSDEEMDFLGIPGLLEPDQVRELLHHRQRSRRTSATTAAHDEAPREVSTHEQLAILRRELNGLVAAWHHRTGQPHGVTHAALRKECGGPAAAVANADQLRKRIDQIREWAMRKSS